MGRDRTAELAACGWRLIEQIQPDGSVDYEKIPLTEAEFLHPQEGYRLPNSTFHDDVSALPKTSSAAAMPAIPLSASSPI